MLNLPPWAKPYLNDKPCPFCGAPRSLENVIAVGIREIIEKPKDENGKHPIGLYFEHYCPECKKNSLTIIDCDEHGVGPIKLLEEIRQALSNKSSRSRSKIKRSSISKQEIEEAKDILDNAESHEDFMRKIGIEEDMIQLYKYKRDKNDNDS